MLFDTFLKINQVKNIVLLKHSPLTWQKGKKGKGLHTKKLVNQKRAKSVFWQKTNTSSRFFQKVPLVLYSTKVSYLARTKYFLFKSSNGLLLLLKNLKLREFGFYHYNYKSIMPLFPTVVSSKQLLFVKVSTRVTKLRDLFAISVVFATAFRSEAKVMFFDRWAGFFTIKLPSGALRFFFYLSRFEPTSWVFLAGSSEQKFNINWQKAGTYSKLGHKPKVRGVAKNPVDHPHGGRTKSIRFQRTPWGLPTKLK